MQNFVLPSKCDVMQKMFADDKLDVKSVPPMYVQNEKDPPEYFERFLGSRYSESGSSKLEIFPVIPVQPKHASVAVKIETGPSSNRSCAFSSHLHPGIRSYAENYDEGYQPSEYVAVSPNGIKIEREQSSPDAACSHPSDSDSLRDEKSCSGSDDIARHATFTLQASLTRGTESQAGGDRGARFSDAELDAGRAYMTPWIRVPKYLPSHGGYYTTADPPDIYAKGNEGVTDRHSYAVGSQPGDDALHSKMFPIRHQIAKHFAQHASRNSSGPPPLLTHQADSKIGSPCESPSKCEDAKSRSSPEIKPKKSYVFLIREAILKSPNVRLTLKEIYAYVETNYPYFKTKNGWKNSIRHNLSLQKCFIKLPREDGRGKKGSYWTYDTAHDDTFEPGNPGRRRRMPKIIRSHLQQSLNKNVGASSFGLKSNSLDGGWSVPLTQAPSPLSYASSQRAQNQGLHHGAYQDVPATQLSSMATQLSSIHSLPSRFSSSGILAHVAAFPGQCPASCLTPAPPYNFSYSTYSNYGHY